MTALRETGPAKLNLTLEVLGRRADGLHELRSLVAFAELGDWLAFEPGPELVLAIEGPFASALEGDNLILAAAKAVKAAAPTIELGHFRLSKMLPVAAGLGGGSADAAATLRLLNRANPGALAPAVLADLAAKLGSDVTVCLESRPALMSGRGERVAAVRGMPGCGVVLVNPRLPLATGAVYGALNAPPFSESRHSAMEVPEFGGRFEQLIAYAQARANDLEPAASRLVSAIGEAIGALKRLKDARLVRQAGSGPTCFALFASADEAKSAAATVAASNPSWWVAASTILPSE